MEKDKPDSDRLQRIVRNALDEDIGDGDITTESILPSDRIFRGRFIAKEDGIVAGLEMARITFSQLDENMDFTVYHRDGAQVEAGTVIAGIRGSGRAVLSGERVALNFMQRMSGIATLSRRFVDAVSGTDAVILDTRKTAPGLREVDKWAVRIGGGRNHRFGLFDMAMIKENHIAAAGSITRAVDLLRKHKLQNRPVEVEVKNLAELREALELSVDRILLDNMNLDLMGKAVEITRGKTPLEASGNVSLNNAADIAATGVDYISVGALTHSVQAMDISLLFDD
jgi:nicotinate-nucleotide pyrophosphorylase (carboxylating)